MEISPLVWASALVSDYPDCEILFIFFFSNQNFTFHKLCLLALVVSVPASENILALLYF